jgi:hypothetical protein
LICQIGSAYCNSCIALIESAEHGHFVTLLHKNTPFLPVDRAQKSRLGRRLFEEDDSAGG